MDYSRWLRSSPSHDRDPASGERRERRSHNKSDDIDQDHASPSTSSTATRPKSSLFDVPPGSRTIVSGGRQNARQTPLTHSQSHSHLGSSTSTSNNAGMMVDELEGQQQQQQQQQQHRGRLTRLQRKSMLKSDEASMLANENPNQQQLDLDHDGHAQEQDARSMDYTFAAPAPPISAPASTSYFQQQQPNDSDPYPSLSQQFQASTSYTLYQPSHGRSLSSIETSFEPGTSSSRGPRSANSFAGHHQHAQHLQQTHISQQQQKYNSIQHSRSSSVSSVQGGFGASMFRPHSQSISSSASSSFNGDSVVNPVYAGGGSKDREGATTPSGSGSGRRVNRLTNLDRKELCEYAALHPRMKHDLLGQLFNVERSTVSKILKNRTKWLAVKQDNTLSPPSSSSSTFPTSATIMMAQPSSPKRNTLSSSSSSSSLAGAGTDRPTPLTPSTSTTTAASAPRPKIGGRHPELEVLLGEWGRSETRQGTLLSDDLVREQALKIAASLNIPISSFKASVGWLDNFKERMGYKNGEFDLDPKYEKLPDNHPELKNKRNEEHRRAMRERKENQIANTPGAATSAKMTLTVGTTGGGGWPEDMDESDSVSPCWTPSEASYRSAGSGWLSPVSLSGGGGGSGNGSNSLRLNTREPLSLSSSAASLPGLIEEDDDDFSEEDLIRSYHSQSHSRNNTNNSSGSSGLRSSSRSSLALHSITGVHSNSSSANPSPTSYTHPQLHGSDSSTMQHMTTPRQQRHHPYQQQQQQQQDYNHTPLSPHHGSFSHHLQFGNNNNNNKSMQQASIAFNLNLNSTPLQTIEARTPLDLHSPRRHSDMRGNSTSPVPAGLGFSHATTAGADNEAGLASSSSGRSVYSLRSRMASAPQTQQQQQLSQSTRTRQATYPQYTSSSSAAGASGGVQEQSSYMIPGFPSQPNPPAKFPLQRAHTAPMIPQLDEHHFDHAMGAVSPQSQPELYLSSDHYQQQYLMQGPSSSDGPPGSDYGSQQMMQMDSDMTTVAHDSVSSSHFSPSLQPFDIINPFDTSNTASIHQQQHQQQLLDREQAILAAEGQLSYTSPNAYSPTSFGGNALLPPGQSPHLLNPPSMASSSSTNPTGGSYGTSLSPATAHWSEKVTFDEAYLALRKVVGFLHEQQNPGNQYGQQQQLQAGLAGPNQVATLEHLLGQFRAASASRYPHLTPPSST